MAKKQVKFNFDLKPKAAVTYLNNKGFKTSFDYDEITHGAHHKVFTVAKVTRHDLLLDVFNSLSDAMKSGEVYADWAKKLKPTLEKKGWLGSRGIIDPKTGEVKSVYIGSRRLKTIFNTNMRVAYNVQRHKSMSGLSAATYWRYVSVLLSNTRDDHRSMHGKVLHRNDSFWQINYPPNGWNCKCKVQALTKKQAERRGAKILDSRKGKVPSIADKDWAYDVGRGNRVAKLSKLKLDSNLAQLKPNKALDKLDDDQLKDRFYKTLGVKAGDMLIDKTGDPMWVGNELFKKNKAKDFSGTNSKLKKRERHLYLDELANTIKDPDEIYLEVEVKPKGKSRLVKKMFRYFKDDKGNKKALVNMFEYQKDKTIGITSYVVDGDKLEVKRSEKLIYKKKGN